MSTPIRRTSTSALVLALATACAAAGCAQPLQSDVRPAAATTAVQTPRALPRPVLHQYRPPPPAKVTVTHLRLGDGTEVTLARFSGSIGFALHNGNADPGPAAGGLVHAGPSVGRHERRMLVAAFNGGFKLSAGVGGYEQEGHVISPLRPGLASLVIYRSGAAAIGAWGRSVPKRGRAVYSVRQNLYLLVSAGRATPAAVGWGVWGATITGGEYVARSALGENAAGQLIYAGSMSASPAGMAAALVHAGARVGMQLDINPEWVQLAYARRPGGHLRAGIPGQFRPPDQYLVGWTRDFIAVLATAFPVGRALPADRTRPLP